MANFHERINEVYQEAQALDYTIGRKAFAALIGVSRSQLNGWLDGSGRPNVRQLKIISQNLGIDASWLIGETDLRDFLPCAFTGLAPEAEEEYEYLLMYLRQRDKVGE